MRCIGKTMLRRGLKNRKPRKLVRDAANRRLPGGAGDGIGSAFYRENVALTCGQLQPNVLSMGCLYKSMTMKTEVLGGRQSGKRGFTLAEVVIAAAVLLATLGAFLTAFVQARKTALIADERIKAVHFTRQNLETLLTNTYTSGDLGVTNRPAWTTNLDINGSVTTRYYCGYSVATGSLLTARIITVTNSWYSMAAKRTNSVSLSTIFCKGFQY
jgi:Tfp pilus assembly protein PilV